MYSSSRGLRRRRPSGPPDAARRVHERAAQVRRKILEQQDVQDIGVQIIRELRGELPAP